MVISVAEVKALLGITSTDYDDAIKLYIPIMTEQIVMATKDNFLINDQFDYDSDVLFKANDKTIQMVNHDFINEDWQVGFIIRILNSNFNVNYFKIKKIVDDLITVDDEDIIVEEDSRDKSVYMVQSLWPRDLLNTLALMVQMNAIDKTSAPISSESIGNYSVTYVVASPGVGQVVYPQNILQGLKPHQKIRFKRTLNKFKYPWERYYAYN